MANDGNSAQPLTRRDVDHVLRRAVWPALKEHLFARAGRTAWRDRPDQVDVINFQSFNAYNAAVLKVTPYSFQINLGTFPRCRATAKTPRKDGQLRPQEYQCDFRRQLTKTIEQVETARPTLWFVRPDGANLDEVADDARRVLLDDGLGWFADLTGVPAMLDAARRQPAGMGATWRMGNIGSPHRLSLLAALEEADAAD